MDDVVVGIDFGTNSTYGAVVLNGNLKIYGRSSQINSISDVKRIIGRTCSDDLVQQIFYKYPFELVNKNGDFTFKFKPSNEECYKRPEDFCSDVFKCFKFRLLSIIDSNVIAKAVLTVPVYFTNKQRQAMMEAAKLANIKVISLVEEPTAAFIGHLDQVKDTTGLSIVFHLGGGTFDISILEYSDCKIVVKCIDGDKMLGGNDFNKVLKDYYIKEKKYCNADENIYEEIKRYLSYRTIFIGRDTYPNYRYERSSLEISRKKFEELADSLFERCMDIVKRCLTKNNINKRDIKNIILVGGSTRIPKIKELLSNFFENSKIIQSINPQETVAIGAALYGHIYQTPFARKLVPTASNNF